MNKVIVGLSGGVDSAVAAALLQRQGHAVEGLFMFNWAEDEDAYCDAAEDYASARAVAELLGIPLHRADFSREYRSRVFQHFLDEYRAGRTPSPDLLCNREIKFGEFLTYARQLGADAVATGHYARLDHTATPPRLLAAADADKDQTYFLAAVPAAAFSQVLFPLGDYHKHEVRELARHYGLPNHQRKDSTGVCFIGERPMREFLGRYLPMTTGEIVDERGRVLGRHPGLAGYTLGQRRGLGIGGVTDAAEAPWFVYAKDLERNQLRVTQDPEHPLLKAGSARLQTPFWLDGEAPPAWQGQARIRHRQPLQNCRLERSPAGWRLDFEDPQWAIAPGQYAVFYAGDSCLGCAVIDGVVEHSENSTAAIG